MSASTRGKGPAANGVAVFVHRLPVPRRSARLGRSVVAGAMMFFVLAGSPARAETPQGWVNRCLDDLVVLYQYFHQHPELSRHEEVTAHRVAEELRAAGCEVTSDVGGHGVVGLIRNGNGPVVMWRGDMDALPVTENTGLQYASSVRVKNDDRIDVGVMHACGHDIHITNLIAAARYMAAHRETWSGTLMLIAQPAEETGQGAQAMIEDGLLRRFPRPHFALALHVNDRLPTGVVGYIGGHSHASTDSCDITVRGRGGHGAAPHKCVDPIVQAAELVLALQTIVSREVSPLDPAVVTVGSIHGGTKHNVIPDECRLQLTIRCHSEEVRERIQAAIRRKALAIAAAYSAPEPQVVFSNGLPPVFNNEDLVGRVMPAIGQAIGVEHTVRVERVMGGEDFARYGEAGVPIFTFRLGAVSPQRLEHYAANGTSPPSLHSAEFYPEPKETLRTGLVVTVAALQELLRRPPASRDNSH